jgi:hypothetical protein
MEASRAQEGLKASSIAKRSRALGVFASATLVRHPHVHCVVPAGGLSPDRQRWVRPTYAGFFLPVKVLRRVFRGKFVEALRRAYDRDELDLAGATASLRDGSNSCSLIPARQIRELWPSRYIFEETRNRWDANTSERA